MRLRGQIILEVIDHHLAPYLGALSRVPVGGRDLPRVAPALLDGFEGADDTVAWRWDGDALLFRRTFGVGRRAYVAGRVTFGPDGAPAVRIVPFAAANLLVPVVFLTFGEPLVIVFLLVVIAIQAGAAVAAARQVVLPALGRALAVHLATSPAG